MERKDEPVPSYDDLLHRVRELEEERIALQERLDRAGKMEALGLLAGGVAHDLNNILTGLVGYPEALMLSGDLPEDLMTGLADIRDSGLRAAAVVHDLLTITRGSVVQNRTIDLAGLLSGFLGSPVGLRVAEEHPQVEIRAEMEQGVSTVKGSEVHFRKCISNLVMNAAEAIGTKGTVTVSLQRRKLDEPLAGYEEIEPGDYVVLAVRDDGPGISKEERRRIFEPFYTRKVMGRSGTGLGLTLIWNTVHEHGGYVDLKTAPGDTVFELYFPATKAPAPKAEPITALDAISGSGQHILVVDDNESQRVLATKILKMLRYRVSTASSGEEAIELAKECRFDLALLDMIMEPGMDGAETYEALCRLQPNFLAIFVSGFANNSRVQLAQQAGAGTFVAKPYTVGRLGSAIKAALEYIPTH